MPVGLGAGGAVGLALETAAAPGTWVTPAVWVPITNETLVYTEDRYYSEAIRNQTISQAAKQGFYHVEGAVELEFDTRYVPYFLHASRNGVTKVGAGSPWTYTYAPTSGAIIPATNRTLSITILRNGVWFGYTGCVVSSFDITVDGGILKFNAQVLGLQSVAQSVITASPPTPTFTAPQILGAAAHSIAYGDNALTSGAAGVTAMASTTVNTSFNGFTFTANDNGAAQNRINTLRSPSYISFGITEAQITSEIDFLDRTEYDHFVAADSKRFQFISSNGANDKMAVNVYNAVYGEHTVDLGNWGDLVMANSTLRVLSSGGTNPGFDIVVVSSSSITVT